MPDNCNPNECPVASRVDSLEREFDRYRDNSSETHKQMFNRIGELEQGESGLRVKLDGIDEKLDKLLIWQEAQKEKPVKRWDGLIDKAVWAVAAAVIAFLLARIGL